MAIVDAAEFRLVLAIVLNGAVLWTSHRMVLLWSSSSDRVERAIDLILWYAAIVATIVCGLGWLGALNVTAATAVVLVMAGAVGVFTAGRRQNGSPDGIPRANRRPDATAAMVVTVLAVAFVLSAIFIARNTPALATDALVYHLALPARWLQDGGISVIPLWFHNPGNSYSPVHASCLFGWLMLPMGNDVLARFGQVPLLLLCGLCICRLLRRVEISHFVAAATAAACCLSRSFLAEAVQTKDDVILTGYFLAAVVALDRRGMATTSGSIRFGLAVGLLMSTKYTAVLALPAIGLLLLPVLGDRAVRRRLAWALVPVLVLAGPWYLRNTILTGNPVFPIEVHCGSWTLLSGVFATRVAPEDQTLGSLMNVLLGTSRYSMRWWLLPGVAVGWAAAWVLCRGRWRHPTVLAGLVGPPLLLTVFYFVSPDREVRYLFPAIALLFVAAGLAIGRLPGSPWLRRVPAAALLCAAAVTAVPAPLLPGVVIVATVLTTAMLFGRFAWRRWCAAQRHGWAMASVVVGLVTVGTVYVYWGAYVDRCRVSYHDLWAGVYKRNGLGPAWVWLDRNAGRHDVIACAATPMTYPLMGFDLSRRVVYVPVQPGIDELTDLPRIEEPLTRHQIVERTVKCYRSRPDRRHWLDGIARARVRFLLITPFGGRQPVEGDWADADPRFRLVLRSSQTRVYIVEADGADR